MINDNSHLMGPVPFVHKIEPFPQAPRSSAAPLRRQHVLDFRVARTPIPGRSPKDVYGDGISFSHVRSVCGGSSDGDASNATHSSGIILERSVVGASLQALYLILE